ncbi:hypothetical protein A2U01_0108965, partial [Trifolium medium]|nr:hypothetical protein [Trifolium medium]
RELRADTFPGSRAVNVPVMLSPFFRVLDNSVHSPAVGVTTEAIPRGSGPTQRSTIP